MFSFNIPANHTFDQQQSEVLSLYLSSHNNYRVATSKDCHCDEDIRNMRETSDGVWKAVPDYFPYRAVGDFNSDGQEDFAVVLVDNNSSSQKPFLFLVFNGPIRKNNAKPAFEERELDLSHQGLFFGPPRPEPFRLLLGPFESEGKLLMPKGKTYSWK